MDESKFIDPRQESHVNGLALKGPVKHLTIDDLHKLVKGLEARTEELERHIAAIQPTGA